MFISIQSSLVSLIFHITNKTGCFW